MLAARGFNDSRGQLFVLENGKEIPFLVKRVYYITGVDDITIERGFHAHKKLYQVMFCTGGSCEVTLDNGHERETILLDSSDKCIYVKPNIWRELRRFSSPSATLVVLASEVYDETDYIRNYEEFLQYVRDLKL